MRRDIVVFPSVGAEISAQVKVQEQRVEIERLKAELEHLRAYVAHRPGCPMRHPHEHRKPKCDCGLDHPSRRSPDELEIAR